MIVDFRTHILPNMDDGSESLEMSINMLEAERHHDVKLAVYTPLYNPMLEQPGTFLQRRKKSYDRLEAIQQGMVQTILGAEVYFTKGILDMDMTGLQIGETDTLLLQLPMIPYHYSIAQNLETFIQQYPGKIVLTGIENYKNIWSADAFQRIANLPVYKQVDCSAIVHGNPLIKHTIFQMIADNQIQLIGSNVKNCTSQPIEMQQALEILQRKNLSVQVQNMMRMSEKLALPSEQPVD